HDEHEHHHHDHDEHEHHHHDHDEHDHDHEHHHHHHAEDIFTSWGRETTKKYTKEELDHILRELEHQAEYGLVIRSKGIVENADGGWIHFEYTPGEPEIKEGSAGIIGRLCVIGADIDEEAIAELFGVE
ncbi:MAG: cobalamin biosynthesis protein CobW, partial [Firmicutes bacterium]|nr:cobalamin biosynthesis protein CobW [Bacillota bacterium]